MLGKQPLQKRRMNKVVSELDRSPEDDFIGGNTYDKDETVSKDRAIMLSKPYNNRFESAEGF